MIKLFFCIGFSCVFCSCFNDEKLSLTTQDIYSPDDPIEEVRVAKILLSDSGRTSSFLKMPLIATYKSGDTGRTVADKGVHATFYKPDNTPSSYLTADKALLFKNNDIELYHNVVINTVDSATITTQFMRWYEKEKYVRSNRYVHVKKPTEDVSGIGFESDVNILNYKIYNVQGKMKVNKNDY